MKWMIATVIALALFSGAMRWLRKFGFGRLPGDLNFRVRGQDWSIPLMSTIVLSMIAAGVSRWLF